MSKEKEELEAYLTVRKKTSCANPDYNKYTEVVSYDDEVDTSMLGPKFKQTISKNAKFGDNLSMDEVTQSVLDFKKKYPNAKESVKVNRNSWTIKFLIKAAATLLVVGVAFLIAAIS